MGIMDLFRSNEQQAASANAQQSLSQQPNHTGSVPTPSPEGKMPGTDQGNVDPLAVYAKMFDKATANTEEAPSFQLDPNVLSEVSSKLNFTQDISPELMQQATNGDANALIQIINAASQNAYKAALSHTSTLTDKFIGARTDYSMKNVGSKVKQELTNSALSNTPNYNHPVVKAQLNMVAESLSAQHPDATPQEIAQMAGRYIQDLASAISPQQTQQQQEANAGTDWSKYLS